MKCTGDIPPVPTKCGYACSESVLIGFRSLLALTSCADDMLPLIVTLHGLRQAISPPSPSVSNYCLYGVISRACRSSPFCPFAESTFENSNHAIHSTGDTIEHPEFSFDHMQQ